MRSKGIEHLLGAAALGAASPNLTDSRRNYATATQVSSGGDISIGAGALFEGLRDCILTHSH